jgi:hypothetical protein
MANFCFNCQRYQSFATERTCILPISMEKQIGRFLVAVVVAFEQLGSFLGNLLPKLVWVS